jgi:poly-gamma-glutamate biosynthesis protein PgsC/CapC
VNDYFYSADVVRVTFIVGIVVSMLFYERTQLTTGGSIVPAYLALGLHEPRAVVTTVAGGYVAYVAVNKGIGRKTILYGRRKFEIEVLAGLAFVLLVLLVRALSDQLSSATIIVTTIGFLIPGIIAHDMFRQGPAKTTIAIVGSTLILGSILTFYLLALQLAGIDAYARPQPDRSLGFNGGVLIFAIVASVLIGMILFARLGVRSGGFISAAYLAALVPHWDEVAFLLLAAAATWLVVVKVLMPRLMLFGRRKRSSMVLFGAILSWTGELSVKWASHGRYDPGGLLAIMTLMVPALIANDAERQGWERTMWGVVLTTLAVYGIANLAKALMMTSGLS